MNSVVALAIHTYCCVDRHAMCTDDARNVASTVSYHHHSKKRHTRRAMRANMNTAALIIVRNNNKSPHNSRLYNQHIPRSIVVTVYTSCSHCMVRAGHSEDLIVTCTIQIDGMLITPYTRATHTSHTYDRHQTQSTDRGYLTTHAPSRYITNIRRCPPRQATSIRP